MGWRSISRLVQHVGYSACGWPACGIDLKRFLNATEGFCLEYKNITGPLSALSQPTGDPAFHKSGCYPPWIRGSHFLLWQYSPLKCRNQPRGLPLQRESILAIHESHLSHNTAAPAATHMSEIFSKENLCPQKNEGWTVPALFQDNIYCRYVRHVSNGQSGHLP